MKLIPNSEDKKLAPQRAIARKFCYKYNKTPPNKKNKRNIMLNKFLGTADHSTTILSPFYCDYGYNIHVGKNFFANYGLTILDSAKIQIGDDCRIAPNVSIYATEHPLNAVERKNGAIVSGEIRIGNNV